MEGLPRRDSFPLCGGGWLVVRGLADIVTTFDGGLDVTVLRGTSLESCSRAICALFFRTSD